MICLCAAVWCYRGLLKLPYETFPWSSLATGPTGRSSVSCGENTITLPSHRPRVGLGLVRSLGLGLRNTNYESVASLFRLRVTCPQGGRDELTCYRPIYVPSTATRLATMPSKKLAYLDGAVEVVRWLCNALLLLLRLELLHRIGAVEAFFRLPPEKCKELAANRRSNALRVVVWVVVMTPFDVVLLLVVVPAHIKYLLHDVDVRSVLVQTSVAYNLSDRLPVYEVRYTVKIII